MNGVDQSLFYPRPVNHELLRQYGVDGKFICSYVGTIGMACGLKTVLEAAELLKKQNNSNIAFILVGDGAVKQELEKEAQEKNLDNVIFTGRRPKQEIPEWISSSNVNLVHLIKSELFTTVMPSKIFESAGCGRPVLMGVEGFARKIVDDAGMGINIEPENPQDMVEALLKISAAPELEKELGENGLKNIVPVYNRDSQAQKYIDILSGVICKRLCSRHG